MGGIIKGIVGGSGKKKAAKQAQGFVKEGAAQLDPFAETGASAVGTLGGALGLGGGTGAGEALQRFRESLGFRDIKNQALRGAASNTAARGVLGSSGTGRVFQETAGGLADASFQDFLSRLFGLSEQGRAASTGQAQLLAGRPVNKGLIRQSVAEPLGGVGDSLAKFFLG